MSEPLEERPEPAEPSEKRPPAPTEREAWLRQAAEDARRLQDEYLSDEEDAW